MLSVAQLALKSLHGIYGEPTNKRAAGTLMGELGMAGVPRVVLMFGGNEVERN